METCKKTPSYPNIKSTVSLLPHFSCQGQFICNDGAILESSLRKRIILGDYIDASGVSHKAVAIVFKPEEHGFFGREVAALSQNSFLDVGPQVFDVCASCIIDSIEYPAIIEEYVGISLERALFDNSPVPFHDDSKLNERPLYSAGTPEREIENKKIAFDILSQVYNLHRQGIFHRDIRPANICVCRYGTNPEDIHASLIDYELMTSSQSVHVPASAQAFEDVIFFLLPKMLNREYKRENPNSLQRDLGYLAATLFELWSGQSVRHAKADQLAFGKHPFFSYSKEGTPLCHHLDLEEDIVRYARDLGLTLVEEFDCWNPTLLNRIRASIRHSGFLDARDKGRLSQWIDFDIEYSIQDMALKIYELWREQCELSGRKIEYASFGEQPLLLQQSNVSQARDIINKLRLLGYTIVPSSSKQAKGAIEAFSVEENEYLAYLEHRRWVKERHEHGWIYGEERNDEKRVHPDLVTYDKLSEEKKEYNRVTVSSIIDILARCNMVVIRNT